MKEAYTKKGKLDGKWFVIPRLKTIKSQNFF